MYNEVFLKCPRCGKSCTEQISQVTLGFGGFDLDNPESLAAALDEQQLRDVENGLSSYAGPSLSQAREY